MAALPSAATLQYFDNSNSTPAPYGVTVPFNNEQQDVWVGYDVTTGQLCITNYNRRTVIVCFAGLAALNYTMDIAATGGGPGTITLTATPSVGVAADYTYVWSIESRSDIPGETANCVLAPTLNVLIATNGSVENAWNLIRCRATNTVTGVVKDAHFNIGVAGIAP
jgi:hypothetical protein